MPVLQREECGSWGDAWLRRFSFIKSHLVGMDAWGIWVSSRWSPARGMICLSYILNDHLLNTVPLSTIPENSR